jgi:hypothetical protein
MILALSALYYLRDIFRYGPTYVRTWMVMMMIGLGVAPWFYVEHLAAQLMIGGFLIGGAILGWMHMKMGITRLMGISHAHWIVPMYFIYADLLSGTYSGEYRLWLGTAAFLTTLSLLIALINIIRYWRGNRTRLAPPAP